MWPPAPPVYTLSVMWFSRNEWSDGTLIQSGHAPGMTSTRSFLLTISRWEASAIRWSPASPQLKPVFFWFPLNCVFPDAVCFTPKPNLSSAPKLSWSLKKTVPTTPWFFISQDGESGISFFIPLPPMCTSMWDPWGQKPSVFHWLSLLASIVDSSSFSLPAFLWPHVSYFSLLSLLLFIFYISQLTKLSVLPFTN